MRHSKLYHLSAFSKKQEVKNPAPLGAGFDCVILRSAFESTGVPVPWKFWHERDVRTVVELGRSILGYDPKRDMPFDGVIHNAQADAQHQVRYVSAIIQLLAEK